MIVHTEKGCLWHPFLFLCEKTLLSIICNTTFDNREISVASKCEKELFMKDDAEDRALALYRIFDKDAPFVVVDDDTLGKR